MSLLELVAYPHQYMTVCHVWKPTIMYSNISKSNVMTHGTIENKIVTAFVNEPTHTTIKLAKIQ